MSPLDVLPLEPSVSISNQSALRIPMVMTYDILIWSENIFLLVKLRSSLLLTAVCWVYACTVKAVSDGFHAAMAEVPVPVKALTMFSLTLSGMKRQGL